jgi:exopolysaccharide production protein ExoQ
MLNRYQKPIPTTVSISGHPKRLDWIIAIFLVIIQQNAFVDIAYDLLSPVERTRGTENGFNTASIVISILFVCIGSISIISRIRSLALRNLYSILYIMIVLVSAIWSLHPDLSLRRGCAYVLTIAIAGYIAARFTTEQALSVLARSFAICGVCSVIFVLMFPETGIMSGGELEGNWRGIYPHKNVFGFAMAIAVFVQLQLMVMESKSSLKAYFWIFFYLILVILSRSTTALIMSILYIFVAINYIIWRKNKLYGYNMLLITLFALTLLVPAFLLDLDFFLGVFGKDSTLTGRTDVWDAVIELISQKPVSGWGYRAMWIPTDSVTVWVDRRTGEWGAPSAHNAFLEITLELGLVGLASLILIVCQGIWRAIRCCALGLQPLGLFSLVFFVGAILAGQTIETLGINQEIDWLVFNILSFLAGERLAAVASRFANREGGLKRTAKETPA